MDKYALVAYPYRDGFKAKALVYYGEELHKNMLQNITSIERLRLLFCDEEIHKVLCYDGVIPSSLPQCCEFNTRYMKGLILITKSVENKPMYFKTFDDMLQSGVRIVSVYYPALDMWRTVTPT